MTGPNSGSLSAENFRPLLHDETGWKGTGLGLSICYGIITKMGGKISVNSAIEIGTTFRIHIPLPR